MAKGKRFNNRQQNTHRVVVFTPGKVTDCVHHEIITNDTHEAGRLIGTCQKCGQVRHYDDLLRQKVKDTMAAAKG